MDIMTEEKFRLLTCNSFIGQYIHLIGGKGMGKGDENKNRYFSPLRVSLY